MEQHQIRVSFPVGTKLIISVVTLLFIVIIFLNITTILLFREDKQAYIYESQSSQALLAGREFVTSVKQAVDTLRVCVATIDPSATIKNNQIKAFQAIINNQTNVLMSSIYMVHIQTGDAALYYRAIKSASSNELSLNPNDYRVTPEIIKLVIPELLKNTYSFVNMAQLGGPPILGVFFADISLKDFPSGMPIAVGLVSLQGFGADIRDLSLTIASKAGWILYDSDPTVFYSKENIDDHPLFKSALNSRLMNGVEEFYYNGTHYLGSYLSTGLNLVILTKTEWQKAMRATYLLIEKFFLLGSMAIGVAIILALLFSKTLTAPLAKLYSATQEVAKGNFLLQLEEGGRDEISALSSSFNTMSKRIGVLVQESMEKVQLENEFAIASTVQQTLIPPLDFANERVHIHSHYQAASICGGDWWGFFGAKNKLALMIADATGHGMPSALITASARSCFSVMHKLAQEDSDFSFSPSAMLSYANRVIFDASLGQIMMTFFVGVIDFDTMILTYSSAGHNPPWLFRKEGASFRLNSLITLGQRLGEVQESHAFEEKSIQIGIDDILFLYTDGLTEGKDRAGEMYGKKRVRRLVESQLENGPSGIIKALLEDFMKHNDGKPLDDDVTVAVAKILDFQNRNQSNA